MVIKLLRIHGSSSMKNTPTIYYGEFMTGVKGIFPYFSKMSDYLLPPSSLSALQFGPCYCFTSMLLPHLHVSLECYCTPSMLPSMLLPHLYQLHHVSTATTRPFLLSHSKLQTLHSVISPSLTSKVPQHQPTQASAE